MRLIQQPGKETTNFKNNKKYFLYAHFIIQNNPTLFVIRETRVLR